MIREILSLEGARFLLFRLLAALESVVRFVGEWLMTRPWLALLAGVPAIVSAVGFAAIAPWHARSSSWEWVRRYERAGSAALRRDDWDAATIYFRRLAYLGGEFPSSLYGLALTAERQGDLPVARARMQRIAPETTLGYPPAHFWLAMDLRKRQDQLSFEELDILEHHLVQATRHPAHRAESQVHLTSLYAMRGEIDKAIREAERVAFDRPVIHLTLAELYAQAGRRERAHLSAIRASEALDARRLAQPDDPAIRILWATSLGLQGRFEDAVNALRPGLSWPDPKPFQQALAGTYLYWFQGTTTPKNLHSPQQIGLLERVLQYDRNNLQAMLILCNLVMQSGEAGDRAESMLNEMLDRDTAPAVVHIALGIRGLQMAESELALKHLQQAAEQNPQLPAVLNNIAWDMAHQEQPDLELASRFGEAAVQMLAHPEFHDTLGTILAKMEKAEDALPHLKIAYRQLPPRATIHQHLGDVYLQLGKADLAARHHLQAAELQSTPIEVEPSAPVEEESP